MVAPSVANAVTWGIALLAMSGVIVRPWNVPEALWAVAGAAALIVFGLLPWRDGLAAIGKGNDVYLFLIGMMLLAELARREGLFDYVAALAVRRARGSAQRLFMLVYIVGIVVTTFLSNDATAVVLTPAVFAAARAANAEPLPYLLICAFVANAASFVLPISNPANLVIFGEQLPPLLAWLGRFGVPAMLSIGATYFVLRFTQRAALTQAIRCDVDVPRLSVAGWGAAIGLATAAIALLGCSALDIRLGWPTFLAGAATTGFVCLGKRDTPWPALKNVSWNVLPLVAGLFVLVEGLDRSGALPLISGALRVGADHSVAATAWGIGAIVAVSCNILNNLPIGLLTGTALAAAHLPQPVIDAALIAVDVGPNLSVTGSLATILWLTALRREGLRVSAWQFLKVGILVMPPSLLLAIGGSLLLA